MKESLSDIYQIFLGPSLVLAPAYLLIAAVMAYAVYRYGHIGGGFWRWLLPRSVYLHPSHMIDIQLFAIFRGMVGFGLIGKVTLTSGTAAMVASLIPAPLLAAQTLSPLMLALLLWLPSDFASYWMHRIFHQWHLIWPLHAVHHSAAVLTPITTYRQHPLGVIFSITLLSVLIGCAQGVLIGSLSPQVTISEIAGINAVVVIANAGFAALHHSHVWLSYGPLLEHLIISPAQHQVHHSVKPAHHGKNFGNTLALWDWLFGTLYVIRDKEEITFGLNGDADKPLMSQRLWSILADPVTRMAASMARLRR